MQLLTLPLSWIYPKVGHTLTQSVLNSKILNDEDRNSARLAVRRAVKCKVMDRKLSFLAPVLRTVRVLSWRHEACTTIYEQRYVTVECMLGATTSCLHLPSPASPINRSHPLIQFPSANKIRELQTYSLPCYVNNSLPANAWRLLHLITCFDRIPCVLFHDKVWVVDLNGGRLKIQRTQSEILVYCRVWLVRFHLVTFDFTSCRFEHRLNLTRRELHCLVCGGRLGYSVAIDVCLRSWLNDKQEPKRLAAEV
jgi:hypothetical protein